MLKLTVAAFNSMFLHIADENNCVVWIRSPDFKKQIYVSPSYEKIWGCKTDVLYENPKSWYDFLDSDRNETTLYKMNDRRSQKDDKVENLAIYRINNQDGKKLFIKDQSIVLHDDAGIITAVAGFSHVTTEQQWLDIVNNNKRIKDDITPPVNNELTTILTNELNVTTSEKNLSSSKPNFTRQGLQFCHSGKPIHFSKREAECVFYLLRGKSAKQTGALLYLSQRTVETYLESMKRKLNCRTKLETMRILQLLLPIMT